MRPYGPFASAAQLCFYMMVDLLIEFFLLEEFRDCVDMDEIDDTEDIFCFASGDSFAIGEEFASFVIDIFFELNQSKSTCSKGDQASLGLKGEL